MVPATEFSYDVSGGGSLNQAGHSKNFSSFFPSIISFFGRRILVVREVKQGGLYREHQNTKIIIDEFLIFEVIFFFSPKRSRFLPNLLDFNKHICAFDQKVKDFD